MHSLLKYQMILAVY